MAENYKELAEKVGRALTALERAQTQAPSANPGWNPTMLFERAPAWITLLVAACTGYALLNTRVSTCEYQNQISIADRLELHHRLEKSDDTLTQVRTDLSEIKVSLKELAARVRR